MFEYCPCEWKGRGCGDSRRDCLRLQQVCRGRVMFIARRRQPFEEMERPSCGAPFFCIWENEPSSGLLDLELDLLQDARFLRQLGLAGRKLVRAEHERQDVGVLLAA